MSKRRYIHTPRTYIQVRTAYGMTGFVVESYSSCHGCNQRVWWAISKPKEQWCSVEHQTDHTKPHELHACPGQLDRNKTLRHYYYGGDEHAQKEKS